MDRGRRNLVTAELQGFAGFGEVPEPYDEHVHLLREFEGQMVRSDSLASSALGINKSAIFARKGEYFSSS